MHLKKIIMLLAVVGSMVSVFGQLGGKQYFLVDDRTQMPVLCYPMMPNWLAGGKTNWTAHPAVPVNWYFWTMRTISSTAAMSGTCQVYSIKLRN